MSEVGKASMEAPEWIAIEPDDYAAKYVGWTEAGEQFFLTNPFKPAGPDEGCEYVALYRFDADGVLKGFEIVTLGPRATLDEARARGEHDRLLASLGSTDPQRIEVQPFGVEHDGTVFGLVLREPEDEGDVYAVEAQPGNYMAFFEPWDSGEYDT